MRRVLNNVFYRTNEKPIVWDAYFEQTNSKKPLVIFCHGYKGFKDWGAWHLMAEHFASNGCFFFKFNFSHNGGTVSQPIDFPDLEAFGNNNYSLELNDLDYVLNTLTASQFQFSNEIDARKITLIGHSRGGGISIIKASEDSRITKLITWASVSSFGKRTSTTGDLEQWKKDGVKFVVNGRTKQQMPHFYQFYEDFKANEERLNIERASKALKIPHLIIHGVNDPSVLFEEGENIAKWSPFSTLKALKNADHVFNTRHPWDNKELPSAFSNLLSQSIDFTLNQTT